MSFSIITATFNSEDTILKTIESVKSQEFVFYEHIFIDGGSTDSTVKIIKENAENFMLISEKDDGIYDALNKGLLKSSKKYVAILNSDDCFAASNVLSSVYDKFETSGCSIVYSGIEYVDKNLNVVGRWIPGIYHHGDFLDKAWHPPHPGFFVRRDAYKKNGYFNIGIAVSADFELMFRFMEVLRLNAEHMPLVTVKMRNDGFSSSLRNRIRGNINVLNVLKNYYPKMSRVLFMVKRLWPKIPRLLVK